MAVPKLLFQFGMHFKELLCCDAFEYLGYVGWREFWMGGYEEMNMVWHDFLFYQGNSFLLCYQFMQLMQVFSDLASQHFSSVLHRPYEMVIHVVYASPRAHPMLLFRHSNLYIWSPHVYIPIDRYGLYPTTEVAGISPDSVLKKEGIAASPRGKNIGVHEGVTFKFLACCMHPICFDRIYLFRSPPDSGFFRNIAGCLLHSPISGLSVAFHTGHFLPFP